MRTNLIHNLTIAAFSLLAACNKPPESGPATTEKPFAPATPAREAPDPNLPEVNVTITGNDLMQFDVVAIEAKPGQKVTVTLKNGGIIPKISMGHNFVLLAQDVDLPKFVEAGIPHMGKDYIAPEFANKVLANTKLLGPAESDTISFAAPRKAGVYPYICSFPGHYAIGMKGTLTVK